MGNKFHTPECTEKNFVLMPDEGGIGLHAAVREFLLV